MMERLTYKGQNGKNYVKDSGYYNGVRLSLDKTADRLAYYEDMEEQGRLIKLPCKVGDRVYFAAWFGTEPHTVKRIIEPYFYTDDARGMGSTADFYLKDFGKTVFLTREEAENALKGGAN